MFRQRPNRASKSKSWFALFWSLRIMEYPVGIAVTICGDKLVDSPRLLIGCRKNRHARLLPIAVERVDFRYRTKIKPNTDGVDRTLDHVVEKQSCFVTRD